MALASGSGNVIGPAAAIADNIVMFGGMADLVRDPISCRDWCTLPPRYGGLQQHGSNGSVGVWGFRFGAGCKFSERYKIYRVVGRLVPQGVKW